jgi:RNA polymerase sigma-70 factor (ECF subfamily)
MGVKVAERMLGNRQDAEDVMQEACLKIWKESPRWKPQAKFSTWLYRVVLNACLDRKRRVLPVMTDVVDDILDDHPIAEEMMIATQRLAAVKRALQDLPDRQRAAIVLNYYEDLNNQDAADVLGISLGAYQQLLFRAKQSLKDRLGEERKDETTRTGS